MTFLVCAFGRAPSAGAEYSRSAAGTEYVVTDMGADGSDKRDDTAAFQKALDMAKNNNETVTVTVPAGTYYFNTHLMIYSNTVFRLDDKAVLKSTHNNDYIMTHGIDSPAYQKNGRLIHNVYISGGTWDSNNTDTTKCKGVLKLCNASDVSIVGVHFKSVVGTHFVVLDGLIDSRILDCTFSDFRDYTGSAAEYYHQVFAGLNYWSAEALHIDFIQKNSTDLNGQPYLPSKNVEVAGCTFINVPTGVGTHHVFDYMAQDNIRIHNNTFKNCWYDCINAASFTNFKCSDNTAVNCGGFLVCRRTTGSILNNKASLVKYPSGWWYAAGKGKFASGTPSFYGMEVSNSSNVYVKGNTLTSASSQGLAVIGSRAEIRDNTVGGARYNGIFINEGAAVSLVHNHVSSAGNNGISVKNGSSITELTRNTVQSCGNNGVYAYSSTLTSGEHNTIRSCGYNGFSLSNKSKAVLRRNTVTACSDNGFYLTGGSGGTLEYNILTSNRKCGFVIDASSARIAYNTLYSNSGYDLYVRNGSTNVVYTSNGSDKSSTKVNSGCSAKITGKGKALKMSQFTVQPYMPYTGKAVTPPVYSSLVKGKDYRVEYGNYVSTGRAYVVIKGIGNYAGTITMGYWIIPGTPVLHTAAAVSGGKANLSWVRCGVSDGYTAYISESPGMKNCRTYSRTGNLSAMTIYGLEPGKTYYIQVYAYSDIEGTKYLSAPSNIMTVSAK